MMHTVKHNAEPISAIILSNDGKTIAIRAIAATMRMRIIAVDDWRIIPRSPLRSLIET